MSIDLRSSAFADGELIPERHTKDHGNVSPPLEWSGVPSGTRELAVLVHDPDAPRGDFVHWIVTGLPPDLEGIGAGALPNGAVEGRNDFGDAGFDGPRPPRGDPPHRYVFTLFALDDNTALMPGASRRAFHDALQGKELARGQLTGRYAS